MRRIKSQRRAKPQSNLTEGNRRHAALTAAGLLIRTDGRHSAYLEVATEDTHWDRNALVSKVANTSDMYDLFVLAHLSHRLFSPEIWVYWPPEPLLQALRALLELGDLDACIAIAGAVLRGLRKEPQDAPYSPRLGLFDQGKGPEESRKSIGFARSV